MFLKKGKKEKNRTKGNKKQKIKKKNLVAPATDLQLFEYQKYMFCSAVDSARWATAILI